MHVYRSYIPTCYYVLLKKNYTTMSECMIFYRPIVPEINYSILFYSNDSFVVGSTIQLHGVTAVDAIMDE